MATKTKVKEAAASNGKAASDLAFFRARALTAHNDQRGAEARRAFLAWWGRVMTEVITIGDELGNEKGALARAIGEEDAHDLAVTLDQLWHKMAAATPRFLPPEFTEPIYTPILAKPAA